MTISRRAFLGAASAAALYAPRLFAAARAVPSVKRKLAVVTTEWRFHSHAWHMAERFLAGYPTEGEWHQPPFEVVSAYVDQTPENDLSRDRAREFGFTIYPSVAEALRAGTPRLAVDGVLLIGEHGNYPDNEFGQKKYPRYEMFKRIVDVYRTDGKTAPVFNDKHLSWKWEWAQQMVDWSRELKFPFLAGSSLPVTWRMPSVDLPYNAEVEELMCVAMGGLDSYDFHALEVIQCMAERRRGGETGVAWVQALRDDAVWKAMDAGGWQAGGWDPQLFEACLCRSQTLKQDQTRAVGETHSHRHPTPEQIRKWVNKPALFRFQYKDGARATMLLMNGLVEDFTFAARLKGELKPFSTLFYLPPNPNVTYSAALMSKAEEMFSTGHAPYPIERTLLTTGLVAAGMESLGKDQARLETPHLAVRYQAPKESLFWRT